jgi:hypothetical protein
MADEIHSFLTEDAAEDVADDIYTSLAEAVREAGNIDNIGVCDGIGKTAIVFSGVETYNVYFDGRRDIAVQFNLTGAGKDTEQKALVSKLAGICSVLRDASITVEGFARPRIRIDTLPVPIVHDDKSWIYSARISVRGIMNKGG